MAVEDVYELAYREAVRALEHQHVALTELRSRASMLLAAASVTVSLPGSQALSAGSPLAWLAVAAFVLVGVSALTIVWPRGDWHFDADPRDLLTRHLGSEPASAVLFQLDLIARMAEDRHRNGLRIARIAWAFRVGAGLLLIQILSTVAASGALF